MLSKSGKLDAEFFGKLTFNFSHLCRKALDGQTLETKKLQALQVEKEKKKLQACTTQQTMNVKTITGPRTFALLNHY